LLTVPEENVGVYAHRGSVGDSMAGLAVWYHNYGDAVMSQRSGRVYQLGSCFKIASRSVQLRKACLRQTARYRHQKGVPNATGIKRTPRHQEAHLKTRKERRRKADAKLTIYGGLRSHRTKSGRHNSSVTRGTSGDCPPQGEKGRWLMNSDALGQFSS